MFLFASERWRRTVLPAMGNENGEADKKGSNAGGEVPEAKSQADSTKSEKVICEIMSFLF